MQRMYINGKDLKDCKINQGEGGKYYAKKNNPKILCKTTLANFDKFPNLPSDCKLYSNGSHKNKPELKRLDVEGKSGDKFSMNVSPKLNRLLYLNKKYEKKGKYYGAEWVSGSQKIVTNHVQVKIALGKRAKEFETMCVINTPEQNKESTGSADPSHLEIWANPISIREMILAPVDTFQLRVVKNGKRTSTNFSDEKKAVAEFEKYKAQLSVSLTNVDLYKNGKLFKSSTYKPPVVVPEPTPEPLPEPEIPEDTKGILQEILLVLRQMWDFIKGLTGQKK